MSSATPSEEPSRRLQEHERPRYSTGFPVCALSNHAWQPQTEYADSLLHTGNGYPFLHPRSEYDTLEQPGKLGMQIGDVGLINRNGRFCPLFNVFQRRKMHPSSLPRQYEEVQPPLRQRTIRRTPGYFPPGTVLAGKGVQVTLVSRSPLRCRVWTSGVCGGILALPEGASREDLEDFDGLEEYIEKHALDWYRFANGYSTEAYAMQVFNGGLHLITGLDTAPIWSTGIINGSVGTEFEYRGRDDWRPPDAVVHVDYPRGNPVDPVHGNVFARGICIALSPAIWNRYAPRLAPYDDPIYTILSSQPSAQQTSIISRWRWRLLRLLGQLPGPAQDTHPAHPALILLQIMLVKAPSANTFIVHDSVWLSFQMNLRLPEFLHHLDRIFDINNVEIHEGLATLIPRAVKSLQPSEEQEKPLRNLGRVRNALARSQNRSLDERTRQLELWKAVRVRDN